MYMYSCVVLVLPLKKYLIKKIILKLNQRKSVHMLSSRPNLRIVQGNVAPLKMTIF